MKNRLFQFILLISLFASCRNDSARNMTKDEVKSIQQNIANILDTVFQDATKTNLDEALAPLWNSPDFIYLSNGKVFSYSQLKEMETSYLKTYKTQKFDFKKQDIDVINKNCAIAILQGTLKTTFNNDSTSLMPIAETIVLKQINSNWKIVVCHESFPSESK